MNTELHFKGSGSYFFVLQFLPPPPPQKFIAKQYGNVKLKEKWFGGMGAYDRGVILTEAFVDRHRNRIWGFINVINKQVAPYFFYKFVNPREVPDEIFLAESSISKGCVTKYCIAKWSIVLMKSW